MNFRRTLYRVTHLLADWVGFTLIWDVPRLVGRYYSYLLPKQAGGTPQIKVNPTQVRQQTGHPVLWHSLRFEVNSRVEIAAVKSHDSTE